MKRTPTASLEAWLAVDGEPVQIMETHSGHPDATLVRLAELASWLHIERKHDPSVALPTFEVRGERAHGRIEFRGPVRGRLLEALVVLIVELATGRPDWDGPSAKSVVMGLGASHELVVAATPTCPYCPQVVAAALRLAQATQRLAVTIVRADLDSDVAALATPTLWVDGKVVASGPTAEHRLAELVARSERPS